MKVPSLVARLLHGVRSMKRHLMKFSRNRAPKHENDQNIHYDQNRVPYDTSTGHRSSRKFHFRLFKKKDLTRRMTSVRGANAYKRFSGKKSELEFEDQERLINSTVSLTSKQHRKHKRRKALKKNAQRAVEYLAMGISGPAAGYGMPPGFNPNAFRALRVRHEYPEVYTTQQMQWLAQHRRNMLALGATTVI